MHEYKVRIQRAQVGIVSDRGHSVKLSTSWALFTCVLFDVSINHRSLALQRYLTLKDMSPAERKKVNPKVVFFAGKAAPGCTSEIQRR